MIVLAKVQKSGLVRVIDEEPANGWAECQSEAICIRAGKTSHPPVCPLREQGDVFHLWMWGTTEVWAWWKNQIEACTSDVTLLRWKVENEDHVRIYLIIFHKETVGMIRKWLYLHCVWDHEGTGWEEDFNSLLLIFMWPLPPSFFFPLRQWL